MSHQVIRTTNQVTGQTNASPAARSNATQHSIRSLGRWRGTIRLWQRCTRQLILSQHRRRVLASRFWGRSWSSSALKILDRVREHREAVDAAGLFLHALDAQHVAYGRARFDQAESNSTLHEFCVQRQKHPRAGHVDIWRRREIADDQPDGFARGVETREHGVEDVFSVEINNA